MNLCGFYLREKGDFMSTSRKFSLKEFLAFEIFDSECLFERVSVTDANADYILLSLSVRLNVLVPSDNWIVYISSRLISTRARKRIPHFVLLFFFASTKFHFFLITLRFVARSLALCFAAHALSHFARGFSFCTFFLVLFSSFYLIRHSL